MDKSAVDAIIAEAMDACALEHIVKLNTAHLSSDTSLPFDLESRFRKLKSFPTNTAASHSFTATRSLNLGKENNAPPPQPTPPPVETAAPTVSGSDNTDASTTPVTPRAEKRVPMETEKEIKLGSSVPTRDQLKPNNQKPSLPDSNLGEYSRIFLGMFLFLFGKETADRPYSLGFKMDKRIH